MKMDGAKRFTKYIQLIAARHGGIEGLRDVIRRQLLQTAALELESLDSKENNTEAACKALEALERNHEPAAIDKFQLEAIIDAELRPVIDIVDGKFNSTHPLWIQLSTDAGIRGRLEACLESIGRVELPGNGRIPYGGTGFLVGDELLMTNRHVAEIFANGVGTRAVKFKPGARAGVDFVREYNRPSGDVFMVRSVVMIHPYWDMALLKIERLDSRRSLRLSLKDARELRGNEIAVIGYPAFDSRNPADEQNNLFNGRYGVKRMQPGMLQGGMKTASFQKIVDAATHDCSTLGGNSGSAVIDLATGDVVALHFGGRYHEQNFAVPASEMGRDQRIIDAGVVFNEMPRADTTNWAEWWRRADGGESSKMEDKIQDIDLSTQQQTVAGVSSGQVLNFEIPLRITISVGGSRIVSSAGSRASEDISLEAMREPWHDADYSSRNGYDPEFLNTNEDSGKITVPMPTANDPSILARTRDNDDILHYQNFSVRMHSKRRLALVTASNVTKESKLRRPDPYQDYTRKGLSGLGNNDMEKWYLDPRLKADFQIPDVFFTKDRQAFDKGHIVRREDVAWGRSYEDVRRANGDSYHVTNCSPQVAAFNQSSKGEGNWGDLENYVISEAANERLCIFAGPVLKFDDRVFHGVGDGGVKLLARIPSRYWKVIIARVEDGIAAFGFVLEQDLDDVQFEFTVSEDFKPAMYPLKDISDMTGVSFDPVVLNADQFESVRGMELIHRSGVSRKRN